MIKKILIMFFSSIISYSLTYYILKKNYKRFYFINGIIKYPLKCTIKNSVYIPFFQIKDYDNFIFYSLEPINCENYIYDGSHYYLVEPGYYYYINKSKTNLTLNCNNLSFIYYLKLK